MVNGPVRTAPCPMVRSSAPGLLWPLIAVLAFAVGLLVGLNLNRRPPGQEQLIREIELHVEQALERRQLDAPPPRTDAPATETSE